MHTNPYTTLIDSTKAFDMVNHDGTWKITQKFSYPERSTHMVRQSHEGMKAPVTDKGTLSEAFEVIDGVKQNCVFTPTLFSTRFSAMLMHAYSDEHPGFSIVYRTDEHLLNTRRMQAPTHLSPTTVDDLLFADYCAVNTATEPDMERSRNPFESGCADLELIINTDETSVMHLQHVLQH